MRSRLSVPVTVALVASLLLTLATPTGPLTAAASECSLRVGPGIPPPTSVPSGIPGYHAAWYGQSGYPTLCPGQTAGAVVAYYNSGSLGWRLAPFEVAFLGTSGPNPGQDQPSILGGDGTEGSVNTRWAVYNRPAAMPITYTGPNAPFAYVGPGQVAWFQFTVKAPQIPGVYRLYIRPLIEGTTWMEDYGVYWQVTVVQASPPQRVTVTSASSTTDLFIAGSETFRYDRNDAFQFADAVVSYEAFKSLLAPGDVVDIRYEPASEGVSSFNIVKHGNEPPAVNVQAGNFDGGGAPNDVRVSIVPPQPNSAVYDTQRAIVPASTAACAATTGRYQRIEVQGSYIDQNGSFIDKNVPSGTYCYRSGVHNQTAHWTAFGYSAPVTMPTP
jgi:hypothetical protein